MHHLVSRRGFLGKALSVAGSLAAASLAASGCAPATPGTGAPAGSVPQGETPKKTEETITIRVMSLGGALGQHVHDACEQFSKDHPNIQTKVEDVPYGEMSQKTEMGYATGNLQDTLHAFTRWYRFGAFKGWYLALDELLETTDAVPDYGDFYPVSVENEKFEGKTFCLIESPCSAPNSTLEWNRNIFENAGIDPPNPEMDIWDLFELAQKVANKDEGIFGIELANSTPARLAALCRLWGKPEYGEQGDTSTWLASVDGRQFNFIDNPGAIEFYNKFYRPLVEAGAQPLAADQVQGGLFVAGKSAMYQGHQGHPLRHELAIGDKWEFHPEDAINFPHGPEGRWGTAQEAQVKCVYAKTPHPEEALRVLGYMTGYEAGLEALAKSGNYSGRRSCYMAIADKYPHFKQWDELMMSGIVEPYPMPWNFRDVEVLDVFRNSLDPLWSLTETWDRQAPIVQDEVQKIYDLPRP